MRTENASVAPRTPFEALESRRLLSAGPVLSVQTLNLGYFYSAAAAVALDANANVWIAGEADTDLKPQALLTARFSPTFQYQHARQTPAGNYTAASAIAIQSDDKAVVAGQRAFVDGGPHDIVVARFNPDGSPDTTFGANADGLAIVDLGGDEHATTLAVDANGDLVIAGYDATGMIVLRLTPDGALDSTFGVAGAVTIDFGPNADSGAEDIAIDAGGHIVVAGYAADPATGDARFAIARLLDDGSLDNAFGANGLLTDAVGDGAFIHAFAVRADGSIVVAGESNHAATGQDFTVARYDAAGTRQWLTTTDLQGADVAKAIALAADGSIFVAGATVAPGATGDMALARYTAAGVIDTRLNPAGDRPGTLCHDIAGHDDSANAIAIDPDGTIILAGSAEDAQGVDKRLALVRVDPAATGTGGGISPAAGAQHIAVYRNGQFILDSDGIAGASAGDTSFTGGRSGDIPVVGDWNGEGTTHAGLFRDGLWILDTNATPGFQADDTTFAFGVAGWAPVVGDWNGDGKTDVGIYSGAKWGLDSDGVRGWNAGSDEVITFGNPSYTPIVGDWNGDGETDIGVFINGVWGLDSNGVRGWQAGSDASFAFGATGMTPIVGDFNGDHKTDVGVYSNGTWGLDSDGQRGWNQGADAVFAFGGAGMKPVIGDWNNDGISDVAVFTGLKWGLDSDAVRGWTAGDSVLTLGQPADLPLVGRW